MVANGLIDIKKTGKDTAAWLYAAKHKSKKFGVQICKDASCTNPAIGKHDGKQNDKIIMYKDKNPRR